MRPIYLLVLGLVLSSGAPANVAAAETAPIIGRDVRDSTPHYVSATRPAKRSPNVLLILTDDMGYADIGAYGSEIETPTLDRLANEGLRYRHFTVTSICSPTRAALLTGLNHHSVGTGWLAEGDMGYPGYRGEPARNALFLGEILGAEGYATMMVGKWHLTNGEHRGRFGPHDSWPTGRGFDRYWGFLDGETGQFFPNVLHRGTEPVEYPKDGSFYFPDAMADEAVGMLRDLRAEHPDRPFFLYFATGAPHAPHHTKPEDRAKYAGRYDVGWDAIREQRLARQIEMGLVPAGTKLAGYSPDVRPWEELSDDQQRMYARFQENYAAFVDNIDQNVAKVLAHLEAIGELDDTLVIFLSDNGGSREVGPEGSWNTGGHFYHGQPATTAENLAHYDEIGDVTTHPHYPRGWMQASNTPFIHGKRAVYAGGARVPMIVSWPNGLAARGEIRDQFHHVTDVVPTVLELLGLAHPEQLEGREAMPLEGVSMAYSFDNADSPSRHTEQYYEIEAQRAYYADGFKLVAWRPQDKRYDEVGWQLFDLRNDFSESTDIATAHPEKVADLERRWWQAARRYSVLPIDDRPLLAKAGGAPRRGIAARSHLAYPPGTPTLERSFQPALAGREYEIRVHIQRPTGREQGVLVALGSVETGWTLFIDGNRLVYESNLPRVGGVMLSSRAVPRGDSSVGFRFQLREGAGPMSGIGSLLIDGQVVGELQLPVPVFFTNEGLDIGRDTLTAVSSRYQAPNAFTGSFDEVVFELAPPRSRLDIRSDEASR
jgi:arylsulfatase